MQDVTGCRACPRLVTYLAEIRQQFPHYHCRPVTAFGDQSARFLIVGLAPGKHGANATGIPFTGDAAGELLYRTLHDFGYSNLAEARADGSLQLDGCRITNAVKCLPPQNKPSSAEIGQCNEFLAEELAALPAHSVVLALGRIAHQAIVRGLTLRQVDYPFAHAAQHQLTPVIQLLDSYHCSRYNTQTRRLTEPMFRDIFTQVQRLLNSSQGND